MEFNLDSKENQKMLLQYILDVAFSDDQERKYKLYNLLTDIIANLDEVEDSEPTLTSDEYQAIEIDKYNDIYTFFVSPYFSKLKKDVY